MTEAADDQNPRMLDARKAVAGAHPHRAAGWLPRLFSSVVTT